NERGEAAFAVQLIRNAKSMTLKQKASSSSVNPGHRPAESFPTMQLTSRKDKLYSTVRRMKHGGQISEGTFRDRYMPNITSTDGQGSYLRGELRSIINDLFRGMTLSRNPHLWESLPAEKKYDLKARTEYVAISKGLKDLKGKPGSTERERRKLFARK
ncbi:MAG: hypothetical protein LQ347_005615, partial [Umbilicaria vellea]